MSDAIHIRTLHSLGLLPPIFITDEFSAFIRPLVRMRRTLIEDSANYIRRIQKALRAINVRLDAAMADSNSVSGLAIIEAICQGQEDPGKLAELAHKSCKKSPAEIAKLLTGNWNDSVRFEVRSGYRIFEKIRAEMADLDAEMDKFFTDHTQSLSKPEAKNTRKPRTDKNSPKLPIEQ